MTKARLRAGRLGEQFAARHLEQSGYRIVDRNFRAREGEIDLVATAGSTLIFCEVKTIVTRGTGSGRGPAYALEAVGTAKRRQVRRISRLWLSEGRAGTLSRPTLNIRFDAIGVRLSPGGELLDLEHVPDAF
jgi:putative endonuclease